MRSRHLFSKVGLLIAVGNHLVLDRQTHASELIDALIVPSGVLGLNNVAKAIVLAQEKSLDGDNQLKQSTVRSRTGFIVKYCDSLVSV